MRAGADARGSGRRGRNAGPGLRFRTMTSAWLGTDMFNAFSTGTGGSLVVSLFSDQAPPTSGIVEGITVYDGPESRSPDERPLERRVLTDGHRQRDQIRPPTHETVGRRTGIELRTCRLRFHQ